MEPATTLTLAAKAADLGKKLYEVAKILKDREAQQKLDEVIDTVRELKQQASELEDENRGLREELRFKSADFEFRNPYWYEKDKPGQPLCAKCFAKKMIGPMSNSYRTDTGVYRECLVCGAYVDDQRGMSSERGPNGPAFASF